jgi:uncharacterized membrane protein
MQTHDHTMRPSSPSPLSPEAIRRFDDAAHRTVAHPAIPAMKTSVLAPAALMSLAGLAIVSFAFVVVQPGWWAGRGLPPGLALACAKVVVLAIVFRHVRNANVYGMQWSSMLILLFVAEAAVRAMSDPRPSSTIGWIEGLLALSYFGSVLGILRPLKQQARRARDET